MLLGVRAICAPKRGDVMEYIILLIILLIILDHFLNR